MARAVGDASKVIRVVRAMGFALVNLALPIVLAWILTGALHRYLHPSAVRDAAPNPGALGKVRLRLKLPGTHAGIPEPLISSGGNNNASIVFIRLLPKSRAKVGIEFWGRELDEGTEFPVPSPEAEIELECELPAFYPEEGDPAWSGIAASRQNLRRREFVISVDGVVRLRGEMPYQGPPHSSFYFGVNPWGGSFVSSRFTGKILSTGQGL